VPLFNLVPSNSILEWPSVTTLSRNRVVTVDYMTGQEVGAVTVKLAVTDC